jgi:3-phenylpropionate/trans-cinnamate dioxygenase ferredoxin subunit
MPEFERVATVSEIPPGGRKSLVFDERAVLVFRIGDDFYAVEDVCSHDGQPLTDGKLDGYSVECPRHFARFDVRNGRPLCMPAVEPIATYEVRVEGNDVLLRSQNA